MQKPWVIAGMVLVHTVLASGVRGDEPAKPTAAASEKSPSVPAVGHSVHGEAFDDGPRHRAYLMPGMGNVHFPATTAKPEAQAFIDQGVAQLHTFYYFESERSFRQAAQIDPDCAIAYWGMAMSNINNDKRARQFLADARKRAGAITRARREALTLGPRLEGALRSQARTKGRERKACSSGSRRSCRNSRPISTPGCGWRW